MPVDFLCQIRRYKSFILQVSEKYREDFSENSKNETGRESLSNFLELSRADLVRSDGIAAGLATDLESLEAVAMLRGMGKDCRDATDAVRRWTREGYRLLFGGNAQDTFPFIEWREHGDEVIAAVRAIAEKL